MATGIIFIVLGVFISLVAFFTQGVVNSRRNRWLVNLVGAKAAKIIYGCFGIVFAIAGVLMVVGVIPV